MKRSPQYELPCAGEAFSLAGERGVNIERVIEEQRQQIARDCERREFEARMQHTFEQCPGFIGGDTPQSVASKGRIVVEPGRAPEAMAWLKRRFYVAESLGLADTGICFEVAPRAPRKAVPGSRKIKVSFGPVEQFTLAL